MNMTRTISWALVFSILVTVAPLSVYADRNDRGHDRHSSRGDIRVFHNHDLHRWHGGRWVHGHHDHRLGWWWVIGGLWYFYPRVVYPYPNPYIPPVVVAQPTQSTPSQSAPPPAQYWYYCEATKGYYPYVPACPAGWKMVPAAPTDAPAQ